MINTSQRAMSRRYNKDAATHEQYKRSGHRAHVLYDFIDPDRSKYVPHIGAKQRAKGAKA